MGTLIYIKGLLGRLLPKVSHHVAYVRYRLPPYELQSVNTV